VWKRAVCQLCILVLVLLMASAAQAGLQKWDSLVQAANPLHWYKFNEAVGNTDAADLGSGALNGAYRSLVDLGQEGLFGPGEAARFERGGTDDIMITQGADVTSAEWTAEFIVMKMSAEGPTIAQALSDSPAFSIRLVGWGVDNELSFTEYGVIDARFTSVGGADLVAPLEEWIHVAYRKNPAGVEVFVNGVLTGITATIIDCPIDSFGGRSGGASDGLDGFLDEAVIYDYALSDAEILEHAAAPFLPDVGAIALQPVDGATDVLRNTDLAWVPGIHAQTHDVYLGTTFADVNNADVSNPMGVLASQGQQASTFEPGVLGYDQTYYWRVDEVNGAPDNTVFKGEVWSFTVEPYSIPIETVQATASSAHSADIGPEKTVGGVGLNELDQHSSEGTDMWLSGMGDATPSIQYAFDQVYKLDKVLIWNSNQLIESFVGLGAKDITVETSTDGAEWTQLADVPQVAQGTGQSNYTANTTISFAGVMAQYVRITINSGYGMLPQYGLSEVRFFYVPVYAREPQPADGALLAGAEVQLSWRAGREAVSHQVNLGTDAGALELLATTTEPSYAAKGLNYGTTYYWSVTEVNEAEAVSSYAGDIWSFSTPEFGIVDDFDQYDDNCKRIFFAWEDGLGHNGGTEIDNCDVPASNGNGGGSIVGNAQAPFAEQTIVQSGSQSLPLEYDNAFGPSETTLSIDAQDWTASGVQTLSLYFYGQADNSGQLYVKINNSKLSYDGGAADITRAQWQPWNIDLTALNGLQNVQSLTIGIDGGTAAGLLYIDSIRLYPQALEYVTPTEPDNSSLVGLWNFGEGSGSVALDSSGNGHDGSFANVQRVSGKVGGALEFGSGDPVDCGDVLALTEAITIACWVNPADLLGEKSFVTRHGAYVLKSSGNFLRFTTPGIKDYDGTSTLLEAGVWQHVAISFVPNQADGAVFYLNGVETQRLNHSGGTTSNLPAGDGPFQIGNNQWDQFFSGMIDEVHVYDQALSSGEIAWLAGKTEPMHKPL
jgi:hypothetical protein